MSDVTLSDLRSLRTRADNLLSTIEDDLRLFLHKKDAETFRRKPDSKSIDDDVNITTTCSCLMALALTNTFRKFYKTKNEEDKAKAKARSIFSRLINAPWMSSGLTANNIFTSTLVLRTFGLLVENDLLAPTDPFSKQWEFNLGIRDSEKLASFLLNRADISAQFLYTSISDQGRSLIEKPKPTKDEDLANHLDRLKKRLALDLQRFLQSGWIYSMEHFPKAEASTIDKLKLTPVGYKLTELNHQLLVEQYPDHFLPRSVVSLKDIASRLAENPENFAINEYSPSTVVVYWFVDGVARSGLELNPDSWSGICTWAAAEFNRHRSLVLAGHDAMMDPVAMAMAACLCARLRHLTESMQLGAEKRHRDMLPSIVELEHSILELVRKQSPSGIWPKYFPLFHYQDAGSNFCFTFELLEAILCEFGRQDSNLFSSKEFMQGLDRALTWCEKNRLKCKEENQEYFGWNSGGDIQSLKKEEPESWATAVVHMFLWEVSEVLSKHIQKKILEKYPVRKPKLEISKKLIHNKELPTTGNAVDRMMDIELFIAKDKYDTLSRLLRDDLIKKHYGKTWQSIRRTKLKSPLSALLFGPPGTSKTQVAKAIAEDLGWPLLEINPSEFVKGSFENVHLKAEEVFNDLMDLAGVVVFFDEMDALTQNRNSKKQTSHHLDTATQFLTTTMLPKLTDLHDKKNLVFLMATNFQESFDQAIKRAGRFDLLLCMGPPKTEEKISKLELFYVDENPDQDQLKEAKDALSEFTKDSRKHLDMLSLFTFGDFKWFLKSIGTETDIGTKIRDLTKDGFLAKVEKDAREIGLKWDELTPIKAAGHEITPLSKIDGLELDVLESIRTTVEESKKSTVILDYFFDRRATKQQY